MTDFVDKQVKESEKEKICFVIMPISDPEGYSKGHFKRVYDFIIKPACILAGFKPLRADDIAVTNYIILDILKYIIEADMAICDLSGRNPNVLYELGIRQAFDKPVTLIKDSKTPRIFDISGFRDFEYDESLRVDLVSSGVETVSEILTNTYSQNQEHINSLTTLLGIQSAKVDKNVKISLDTELIMNSISSLEQKFSELTRRSGNQVYASLTEIANAITSQGWEPVIDVKAIKKGDEIFHKKFGMGKIIRIEGQSNNPVGLIEFENGELKKIMLNYANLLRPPDK